MLQPTIERNITEGPAHRLAHSKPAQQKPGGLKGNYTLSKGNTFSNPRSSPKLMRELLELSLELEMLASPIF